VTPREEKVKMSDESEMAVALDACEAAAEALLFSIRAVGPSVEGGQAALMAATRRMREMEMSFSLQYLQLQSQMQNENRAYTAISNIMKTRHDTVKNSISNIR
jgi:hypothetical protein